MFGGVHLDAKNFSIGRVTPRHATSEKSELFDAIRRFDSLTVVSEMAILQQAGALDTVIRPFFIKLDTA